MTGLPDGTLIGWYGDDFTGSSAVMEVLDSAGLDSVLFLEVPDAALLNRFRHARAIGIAGTARARGPDWMAQNLPPIFRFLAGLGAPVTHYKVCSTLDSSPTTGSIGCAIELAEPILGGEWCPILIAAPELGRYQAFGNLFASAGDEVHRLDRHPVMRCHPVTPMDEADVRRHIGPQMDADVGLISVTDLASDDTARAALARERGRGLRHLSIDALTPAHMRAAGRLIWDARGARLFAVGSQGVEYALVEHLRAEGLIPADLPAKRTAAVERLAVVSGSVSQTTARQTEWALGHGFGEVPLEAAGLLDATTAPALIDEAAREATEVLASGRSVIVHTARGPHDPAVHRFRTALAATGQSPGEANERIGQALGQVLGRLLDGSGVTRAVVAGGDTSGSAIQALDVVALTTLAPVVPGAALCTAHRSDAGTIELALKGGQMGRDDFYGRIRSGTLE